MNEFASMVLNFVVVLIGLAVVLYLAAFVLYLAMLTVRRQKRRLGNEMLATYQFFVLKDHFQIMEQEGKPGLAKLRKDMEKDDG